MSRVLYIEASPLKAKSHSIAVAERFLAHYRASHPQDQVEKLDLWQTKLPPFDGDTIEAKFAVLRKKEFTPEQLARWQAVQAVSRHFNAADKYVFSVPMWNFGIPYPLKHYIDVVTLAGENWNWSRSSGYTSLLSGKKALLIYSSANPYPGTLPGDPSDFQKPYMRRWLSSLGVTDLREITVAPTLTDPQPLALTKARAGELAGEYAEAF